MGTINKQFTKKDVVKSLRCCFSQNLGCYEGDCPLQGVPDCIRKKIDLAIEFLEESPDEPNNPLNLNELIEILKKEEPVWIIGYGWCFIKEITIDERAIKVHTHTHNVFTYTEDDSMFYRRKVIE